MKKLIGIRTLKTGLGATMAIIVAQFIGLKYVPTAGVITILSIQNTKRESFRIAIRRMIATFIALGIGSLFFSVLGFSAPIFGLYLIVFIPIAVRVKVSEGIVPASVLVTHLLGERHISLELLTNELMLMVVGAGIALLFNLYMPSVEKEILKEKRNIEETMYRILMNMAEQLEHQYVNINELEYFGALESYLKLGKEKAHQNKENFLVGEETHYEKYFDMRYSQYQVLTYMFKHFEKISITVEQTYKISDFLRSAALSVKGKVTVEELLEELDCLRASFRISELPTSRSEFENRAMLYQFLNDMELFIAIKKTFKENLTLTEREQYNKYYDVYEIE